MTYRDVASQMRLRYNEGDVSMRWIAKEYGCSLSTAEAILTGKRYTDVDPPRALVFRPKGRSPGPKPRLRLLSADEVREVKRRYDAEDGPSIRELAKEYKVSRMTIHRALTDYR